MRLLVKSILSITFIFFEFVSYGQDGNIFLKHYRQFPDGVDNQNIAVQQGKNGIVYFANSKGILNYDGSKWDIISTPSSCRSFGFHESSGKLFIGCQDDFGYINTEGNDIPESYKSISGPGIKPGIIYQSIVCENDIYFLSLYNLYKVSVKDAKVNFTWTNEENYPFAGGFSFNNRTYVNIFGKGLHEIKGNKLNLIAENIFIEDHLQFGLPFDSKTCLIGTEDGELYLFDGKSVIPYKPDYSAYLESNLLAGAVSLSNKEICFSTLSGGCLVADKISGKMLYVINYQSGLPDDEIFAVNRDKEGGLWIAHEYGITRADETLPFRNFSLYPGLEGNILSILKYDSTLYVATSEGVFFLSKVKSYEELRKVIKRTTYTKVIRTEEKRALLAKIFRKKKKDESAEDSVATEEEVVIKLAPEKNETADNAEKTYAVHSINYVFRKIPNINDKCRQLINADDRIIVSGNTGLYEIRNFQGRQLVKDFYIVNVFYEHEKKVLYGGLKEGFFIMKKKGNTWENPRLNFLPFEVTSLSYNSNFIWTSGIGKLWRIDVDGHGKVVATKSFNIPGGFSDFWEIKNAGRNIYLSSSNSAFYFDPAKESFFEDKRISSKKVTVFSKQDDVTWARKDSVWSAYFTDDSKKSFSLPVLYFIKDLKNLYIDSESYVWIVDRENNLIRLMIDRRLSNPREFNLIVRQITDEKGELLSPEDLILDYKNNSLSFYFAAPHFKDEHGVLYQYKLEGMKDEWTPWMSNGVSRFPYLPPGEYVLHARAKNLEGQVSDEVTIPFYIKPPYWKTTTFYIFEMIFFFLLITVSVLLNRNSKRGFFWAKFSTFMTLIIIVELVHRGVQNAINIGNADSPVLAFSADVLLALLISPIETVLDFFISKKKRERKRVIKVYSKSISEKLKMQAKS